MVNEEINRLKDLFVEALEPLRIYLFGSYAYGNPNADSDFDFLIVVDDSRKDWHGEAVKAYKAIRYKRTKPVDILVSTISDFERRSQGKYWTLEKEISQKGLLLYDALNHCR